MSSSPKVNPLAALDPPSAGELEILAVLWEAVAQGARALRLSEVRELLLARLGRTGEPSTISTQLRSLHAKGWIVQVGISLGEPAMARVRGVVRTRGAARTSAGVPTRSPFTAYCPKYPAGEALQPMVRRLVAAYPESERHRLLVDVARALELPSETVTAVERLMDKGRQANAGNG